jgi:hypothetical protein
MPDVIFSFMQVLLHADVYVLGSCKGKLYRYHDMQLKNMHRLVLLPQSLHIWLGFPSASCP